MSNATFGLLICAIFVAGPVLAQDKSGGATVSGVTVEGVRPLPMKSCSSRDKGCIASVVAELRARYPDQLLRWCHEVERRAVVTNLNIDEINSTADATTTYSPAGQFAPPPVAKLACAPGGK